MQFEFTTTPRIIFRTRAAREIPSLAAGLGRTPCLVTGASATRSRWLEELLPHALVMRIADEPDTDGITLAADTARAAGCDVIIGMGGGSAMDAAKVIAALITNTGDLFDYLEGVGKGQPLTQKPVPLITVPTTSGTGSEVTTNGVLLVPEQGVKVSLRSTDMIANIAVIDPELTLSMPRGVTAATGMDALTQLIEGFVSNKATPMTDGLCREGIPRAANSLPAAYADGTDLAAREDMALASLLSGMVLANAGLGAVHGFAAPLGGMFKVPHGEVCACLLPHVTAANITALRRRSPESRTLCAYAEAAAMLTGKHAATPDDATGWLAGLCAELDIPGLRDMGVARDDFPEIVTKAARASSMKGNPIELTRTELSTILESAF